jgi:outer membrane protein assembly factor BamB
MKLIKKIQIGNSFCYPCYPLVEKDNLYIGIRYNGVDSPANLSDGFQLQKQNFRSGEVFWTLDIDDKDILCKPIISNNKLIVTTKNNIFAIDKENSYIIWNVKMKNSHSHLSVINGLIYLINDNSITVIDSESGKKVATKKYRIKWFDSPVVVNDDRFFVSTSNSKIIEVHKDTLEVINEYKYPGGWAIACTPDFFSNQIISNSYSAYVSSFDIDSSEIVWRVKKQVGSQPKQLLISKDELLLFSEGLNKYELSAIKLSKGKKIWSKEYHIQALSDYSNDEIASIMMNRDGQYLLCLINKNDGNITCEMCSTDFIFDDKFQYQLWNGSEVVKSEKLLVACYSPNEVFIYE